MSWAFEAAVEDDIDELMSWFSDADSVDIWGGPRFRYPFDRSSFHEDCRWTEFSTHCLRTPDGQLAAFGQLGARYDRAHLARLITHPAMRGRGVGRRLIEGLIDEARNEQKFFESRVVRLPAQSTGLPLLSGARIRDSALPRERSAGGQMLLPGQRHRLTGPQRFLRALKFSPAGHAFFKQRFHFAELE